MSADYCDESGSPWTICISWLVELLRRSGAWAAGDKKIVGGGLPMSAQAARRGKP